MWARCAVWARCRGEDLLTHNYVLVESMALLQARLGLKAAIKLGADATMFVVDQNRINVATTKYVNMFMLSERAVVIWSVPRAGLFRASRRSTARACRSRPRRRRSRSSRSRVLSPDGPRQTKDTRRAPIGTALSNPNARPTRASLRKNRCSSTFRWDISRTNNASVSVPMLSLM